MGWVMEHWARMGLWREGVVDFLASRDPFLWWRLGETSGTTAYDASSNGRNGTYAGNYTLGEPSLLVTDDNPSVALDGSLGTEVTGSDWDITDYLTVNVFCKIGGQAASRMGIASKWGTGTGAWGVTKEAGQSLRVWINSSTEYYETPAFVGIWTEPHLVSFIYDKDGTGDERLRLFIDGVKIPNSGPGVPTPIPNTAHTVKAGVIYNNEWAGWLDEFVVDDRCWSEGEIRALAEVAGL